jgi:hypothetical protein
MRKVLAVSQGENCEHHLDWREAIHREFEDQLSQILSAPVVVVNSPRAAMHIARELVEQDQQPHSLTQCERREVPILRRCLVDGGAIPLANLSVRGGGITKPEADLVFWQIQRPAERTEPVRMNFIEQFELHISASPPGLDHLTCPR